MSDTLFFLKTSPFKRLSLSTGRVFRKELIYCGIFEKQGEPFAIDEADLDNWITQFEAMAAVGVDLPLQSQHDDSPEATRGHVVGLEKGWNEEGTPALFGFLQFRDEEAEKMANSAQVSIYSVAEFKDGLGNYYENCLRHVALCSDPVIPGLSEFQEIAASLSSKKGNDKMPKVKDLAKKLNLKLSEEATEDFAFDQVLSYIGRISSELASLKAALAKNEEDPEDPPADPKDPPADPKDPPADPADPPADPKDPPADPADDEEKKKMSTLAASFGKRFAKQESELRKVKIDGLLSTGRITKVVADDLKKQFCDKGALTLSLSQSTDGEIKDGFDATVSALGKNDKVLSFQETSGPQGLGNNESVSPLVANAQQRAGVK